MTADTGGGFDPSAPPPDAGYMQLLFDALRAANGEPIHPTKEQMEAYVASLPPNEREVMLEVARLRIRDEAARRYREQNQPPMEPFDLGTLGDLLARPAPPKDRIAGLIPWESGTSIVAQRKTGKTTFTLNLARALITGDPFLERDVRKIDGNVGVLNFEVSGAQFGRWAADVGVAHDRMVVANLRGRANPFGNEEHLQALGKALRQHDVETLFVDPFGRAFTGTSQNDNGEVGLWLQSLDRFARGMVGALDVVLVVHAGWKETGRSRGASALEDWPDSIISLTRNDRTDVRQIEADGRDVDMERSELVYDSDTRTLALGGQVSASGGPVQDLLDAVVDITTEPGYEPINAGQMEERLRLLGYVVKKGGLARVLTEGERKNLLAVKTGARNAKLIHPAGPAADFGPID